MKFFKTMDLYKGIVLMSLILLPLGGWWVSKLDENIAACRKALNEATRAGGLIEQIGALQQKIQVVVQNRDSTSVSIDQPATYFQSQIMLSSPKLTETDYDPKAPKEENVVMKGSKQRASDFVVDVDWNKDLKVPLNLVWAVLFNCESGALEQGAAGRQSVAQQSVWRLRNLTLFNADDAVRGNKVPDPELQDLWTIKEMKFARREPKKGP